MPIDLGIWVPVAEELEAISQDIPLTFKLSGGGSGDRVGRERDVH